MDNEIVRGPPASCDTQSPLQKWDSIKEIEGTWKKVGPLGVEKEQLLIQLKEFDTNGDGMYSLSEVICIFERVSEHVKTIKALRETKRLFIKIIIGMAVAAMLLILALFFSTLLAVELKKDTYVCDDDVLRAVNGEPIQLDVRDMVVEGGILLARDPAVACPANVNCTGGALHGPVPLAVREAPLEGKKLSSTMPDGFLNEMKSITLTNPAGSSVALSVQGYARKYQYGSKCGSVVFVNVLRGGHFMLDDFDIVLSAELRDALSQEGFVLSEDGTYSNSVLGRRLSEGHSIVGMFNFMMEYEWRCESFQQPLANFFPPYRFRIQTRAFCPNSCESEIFPGMLLPGMVKDRGSSYIAVTESVIAFDDHVFSFKEFPSHPRLIVQSHTDLSTGLKQQQVSTMGQVHSCSSSMMSSNESFMTKYDSFEIAVVGTLQEGDRQYRRYRVHPKNGTTEDRQKKSVEFWEDAATDLPYKYFMPMMPATSISYFTLFSKELDPAVVDTLIAAFSQNCTPSFGPNVTKDGYLNENEDTLKFYRDLIRRDRAILDEVNASDMGYWNLVSRVAFEDDVISIGSSRPTTNGIDTGTTNGSNIGTTNDTTNDTTNGSGTGTARRASSVVRRDSKLMKSKEVLPHESADSQSHRKARVLSSHNLKHMQVYRGFVLDDANSAPKQYHRSAARHRRNRSMNSDGVPGRSLADLQCPLDFSFAAGGKVGISFCWIGDLGLNDPEKEFGISVYVEGGADSIFFAPPLPISASVTLGGGLDMILTPEFSVSGTVSVSLGINIDFFIAKCGISLEGFLSAGLDGFDDDGQITGFVEGGLGLALECAIFGIQFGPALYGTVSMRFGKLGGSTPHDDEVSITGDITIVVSLWIFVIQWTWEADFLPPTLINEASLQDPSQVPGLWTKNCACGDFFKCGSTEYCDDWELDVPPDSAAAGQRHWCNGDFYEMVHYDWEDKVDCGAGRKRCFCRNRRTDTSGYVLPSLWSNCYEDNQCRKMGHRRRRLSNRDDCIRNECSELDGRTYKGNWQDCGGWKFRGLCEP